MTSPAHPAAPRPSSSATGLRHRLRCRRHLQLAACSSLAFWCLLSAPALGSILDVDDDGAVGVLTDVRYAQRRLLGLPPVPASYRETNPGIAPDVEIAGRVDAVGAALDVDANGIVDVATDLVYIARHLLGMSAVPPGFRDLDPSIPDDLEIALRIQALTAAAPTATPTTPATATPSVAVTLSTATATPLGATATVTQSIPTPSRTRTGTRTATPTPSRPLTWTPTTVPPTKTLSPSRTPTGAFATGTPSATEIASTATATAVEATGTATASTPTPSRTGTPAATATRTRTGTRTSTPSPSRPPTWSPTAVPPTRTASSTRTATVTPTTTHTPTQTGTATPTSVPTGTRTRTATRTPSATPTPTGTATPSRTRTATPTPSISPTRTNTPVEAGSIVTYFALLRPDGCQIGCFDGLVCACTSGTPTPHIESGIRVFAAQGGERGLIVVEAGRGRAGRPPGSVVNVGDPCNERPSIQIEADLPMGDGTPIDCGDPAGPEACQGGIPAVDPPDFSGGESITAALNEFACRFQPAIVAPTEACSKNANGNFAFLGSGTVTQFCANVAQDAAFTGTTRLTVRVLDSAGVPGPTARIEIRVPSPPPGQ